MILVTGATGNIGRTLVKGLLAVGAGPLRGLTRDAARAAFPQGVEAVEGDMTRPSSLGAALQGARSLFLLSRMGPDAEILRSARRMGVEHVVLVSSITVQSHPHLGPARENLAVERLVEDSGMAWTILRPTQFASNALWWADAVRERRPVRIPYPDVGLPAIHPADIASVARAALTEPGHEGLTYALTGPERITPRRQLAAIARAVGRDIPLTEISRTEAHRDLAALLGDEAASAVLDITGGDINEELLTIHDTVPRLTRVAARTFGQWGAENADAFR
ncbi:MULTISPECIES: SDR family oxidoreductase [Streptomyces]|uniref:SDR family oxidoreductase n=2 Tax=Streptomyces TaxID=1883 RepID=A0ABV9ISP5_9ACTN